MLARTKQLTGTGDENPNEKFINALGDSESARKELKQTADHIVIILNDFPGPFRLDALDYMYTYKAQNKPDNIQLRSWPYSLLVLFCAFDWICP